MTLKLLSRHQPARAARGEGGEARATWGGRKCYTDVTVRYTCTGDSVQVLPAPCITLVTCVWLPLTPTCLPDAAEVFSASGHQRPSAWRGEAAAAATPITAAATLVIARPRSDSTSKPRYADQILEALVSPCTPFSLYEGVASWVHLQEVVDDLGRVGVAATARGHANEWYESWWWKGPAVTLHHPPPHTSHPPSIHRPKLCRTQQFTRHVRDVCKNSSGRRPQ